MEVFLALSSDILSRGSLLCFFAALSSSALSISTLSSGLGGRRRTSVFSVVIRTSPFFVNKVSSFSVVSFGPVLYSFK